MRTLKMSFKLNICLYFFFSALAIILLITSAYYYFVREKLHAEIVDNLKSTVSLGAKTIDSDAFRKLTAQLPAGEVSPELMKAVQASPEYRKVYAQLNSIRDTKQGLILYVYTLVPGPGGELARFVVDADALKDAKEQKPHEEISTFGKRYDISTQPITQRALAEQVNIVDNKFVYDEQFKVNSMMGFAPIFDSRTNEFLGIVGADISDKNISRFLHKIVIISAVITVAAILVTIIIAVLFAGSVSQPIARLSETVKAFSDKDFAARATFDTHIKEISKLIDSFNFMAETIQSYNTYLLSLNSSYERFVPVEFLNYLSKENIMQVQLGDQVQKDMAVLFSDIRSFSTLSESMTPKQTFDFLNSYLRHVGPIIRKHTGFVDKYLGDGVMALFPKSADDAVQAAIEVRRELIAYNQDRLSQGLIEINTGIGIHLGTLMLGTIGEEKRMQGTVISDAVNLASRLESLTKDFGVSLLISKEIFNKLEAPEKYKYRFLGNTNVKGKTESVAVFEIYDTDRPEVIAIKDGIKNDFENAVYYYNTEAYALAEELFAAVLARFPEDRVSALYIGKCRDRLGVAPDGACQGETVGS
jgi:class 3 adenylate cyclase/HAMP domain-containing protein